MTRVFQYPVLGIDIGDKRVGLAMARDSVAFPLSVLKRAQGEAEREIVALCQREGISLIVAGLPLGAHGEKNEQCQKVEIFCRRLKKRLPKVELVLVDEFGTSEDAADRLRSRPGGRDRARGECLDALAASIILQDYLNGVPTHENSR